MSGVFFLGAGGTARATRTKTKTTGTFEGARSNYSWGRVRTEPARALKRENTNSICCGRSFHDGRRRARLRGVFSACRASHQRLYRDAQQCTRGRDHKVCNSYMQEYLRRRQTANRLNPTRERPGQPHRCWRGVSLRGWATGHARPTSSSSC